VKVKGNPVGHSHSHHSHDHHDHSHHHHGKDLASNKLILAIVINLLLTLVQIIAGVLSGSLALLADALHNFGDAGALIVALVARRYTQKPADKLMSFGYERAEIVGALVNSTSLFIMAFYLAIEAISRIFSPEPIQGNLVIWTACLALVIDIWTAYLTFSESKNNMNFKAAFIHNLTDALASVVVIISGVLALYYQTVWFDVIATLLISTYVVIHGRSLFMDSIKILMQATPKEIHQDEIKKELIGPHGIVDVHHIHLWQLDENKMFFEGHLVLEQLTLENYEEVKRHVRAILKERFNIVHTTLEIETVGEKNTHCNHDAENS